MLKDNPMSEAMYEEKRVTLADAAKSFPSWDRDALILKIQIIDSCTRRELTRRRARSARTGKLSATLGPVLNVVEWRWCYPWRVPILSGAT